MIRSLLQSLLGSNNQEEEVKSSTSRRSHQHKTESDKKLASGYGSMTSRNHKEQPYEAKYMTSTPTKQKDDGFNSNLLFGIFKQTNKQDKHHSAKNNTESKVSSSNKLKRLSINPNEAVYVNQSMEFGRDDEQSDYLPRKCIDFRSLAELQDNLQSEPVDAMESQTSSTNFSGSQIENSSYTSADIALADHLNKKNKKKKVVKKKKYKEYNLKFIDADKFFQNDSLILSLQEWKDIIKGEKELKLVSRDRIRQSLFKGIPEEIRGDIWCALCHQESQSDIHDPQIYAKLLEIENLNEEYQITKDIHRTLPELDIFKETIESGKNKLYNVLKAYACYDNEIGYVQGMNYLAAILLIHIDDEVKAFWCMVHLLFRKNWRMIYDNNTPKLMNLLDMVKERLQKEDPILLRHLESEDISMVAAFSPVFITLYIYQIPIEYAKRIFEYFIFEGETALMKVLFKMISYKRKKILTLVDHDLLQYFRTDMIIDCIRELGVEQLLNY